MKLYFELTEHTIGFVRLILIPKTTRIEAILLSLAAGQEVPSSTPVTLVDIACLAFHASLAFEKFNHRTFGDKLTEATYKLYSAFLQP